MKRLFKVKEYMKILKYAIVLGAATVAVSANAQFGAASKSEFSMEAGKQGLYGTYSPFARISGGGASGNGYVFGLEKLIGDDAVLGGFLSRVEGSTLYQVHYRKYMQMDSGFQAGILGGDATNNKNDFSLLYFKELPAQEKSASIASTLFGGFYYDGTDKKFNVQAGVKASYPLQNGFNLDATLWYLTRSGDSVNFITIGVGYKF
jgi:hypothetical protein